MKIPTWLSLFRLSKAEWGFKVNREARMYGLAIYKFGILLDFGKRMRETNRQKLVMSKINTRCETCDKHIVKPDMNMVQRFCSKNCRLNRKINKKSIVARA